MFNDYALWVHILQNNKSIWNKYFVGLSKPEIDYFGKNTEKILRDNICNILVNHVVACY